MQKKNKPLLFDPFTTRENNQKLLKQKAIVVWLTGLSGSGKTTLANALQHFLLQNGHITKLIDGDELRSTLNKDLNYTQQHRTENIRRAAEVAKLFLDSGVITCCAFITPTEELRTLSKTIIGENDYVEIYVKCSLEECEKRDVKGLYKKARKGDLINFTGINAPFEVPEHPALVVETQHQTIQECLTQIYDLVRLRISVK